MEKFWFFQLRFRRAYNCAYDSDFLFSQDHRRSYDSAYHSDSDFGANENQSLGYLYQRFNLTINVGEGSLFLVALKFSMNSL